MPTTILVLAANPKNTPPLRLDQEIREIDSGLERSQKREDFILKQKWAARPVDVRRAMLDHKPRIVHFCGHGSGEEGIAFEDETGQARLVSTDALTGFFELFADEVECVVLNACYSEVQAEAIAKHIPYVIGMKKAIGDAAAIEFAVAFYDGLGAGKTIDFAYKLACNAIHMAGSPEYLTPVLKTKLAGRGERSGPMRGRGSPAEGKTSSVRETLIRGKLSISGPDDLRTVFIIPKLEIAFGMAKQAQEPDVDLTLRLLPILNRTESPENWEKSAKISKLHGRLKVEGRKILIKDESLNGIFVRGATEDDDSGIESLGDWAELYGTLDEDQSSQRPLVRLPKHEWTALPDNVDVCLGRNLLRLRLEVCRALENRNIAAVCVRRSSNYPQHEYVLLVQSLMAGHGRGNALQLQDPEIQADSIFEMFAISQDYWIRCLADDLVWLESMLLHTGMETRLKPGCTLRVGHSLLKFEVATDEDFVAN